MEETRNSVFPKTSFHGKVQNTNAPYILLTMLSYPDGKNQISKSDFADKVNDLLLKNHRVTITKSHIGHYLKRQCQNLGFLAFCRIYPNQTGIILHLDEHNRNFIRTMFPKDFAGLV